uniref:Vesicle-fusing ATPase n=1 Tax=Acanthochromis polyacanthus TaxID=80966 RepID=A0A3Q1GQ21_9TELE
MSVCPYVCPSICPSVRPSVRPHFVSGAYLRNYLRDFIHIAHTKPAGNLCFYCFFLLYSNCLSHCRHVIVRNLTHKFVFTLKKDPGVSPGSIGFSLPQRKWAGLSIGQDVEVTNYKFDKSKQCISCVTIEIGFLQKKNADSNPYDSDKMASEFLQHFTDQAFTVNQQVCELQR